MDVRPYNSTDLRTMLDDSNHLSFRGKHTELSELATEIREYLRKAVLRSHASTAKIAFTVTLLDIWTNHSGESSRRPAPPRSEVAELITVGAATALVSEPTGESAQIIQSVRMRLERSIENSDRLRDLWTRTRGLGRDTGFRLDVDASRAERVWRALIQFAARGTPVELREPSPESVYLISTVSDRINATTEAAFSEIKGDWKTFSIRDTAKTSDQARFKSDDIRERPWSLHDDMESDEASRRVPVWFGTNREPKSRNDLSSGYKNQPANNELSYGLCHVNVPQAEDATGGLQRMIAGLLGIGTPHGTKARVEHRLRFAGGPEFEGALQDDLDLKQHSGVALLFIHGYNTSFDDAAEAAAQLSVNIKHPGVTAMFSWASRARTTSYLQDKRSIGSSRGHLAEFLTRLSSIRGVESIDVVVHSLGNSLFLHALIDWIKTGNFTSAPLRNLFLAAPDLGVREFKKHLSVYSQAALKTTVYGSDSDSALLASKLLNREHRVGLMPPPELAPSIDTIETSAIDVSKFRHNGVIQAATIQSDIFLVQEGMLDPHRRPHLKAVNAYHPLPYWRF